MWWINIYRRYVNSCDIEKAADEGNVLKSSILQFRNDVQKQAKRIMQSQESMKSSMVNGQYGAASLLSKPTKPNEGTSGKQMWRPMCLVYDRHQQNLSCSISYIQSTGSYQGIRG
jgi:hypothetical protein